MSFDLRRDEENYFFTIYVMWFVGEFEFLEF